MAACDDEERVDLAGLEPLARRAADGEIEAWKALVTALWPVLRRAAHRAPSLRGSRARDEDTSAVVTAVIDKLGRDDARGLKLYFEWKERHPEKHFGDWILIVTANAARDLARASFGASDEGEVSVKRLLNEFSASPFVEQLGHRPPFTAQQTARQILEFAESRLPSDAYAALTRWLDGASFDEIRDELALESAEDAQRVVRAAVAVLRRNFPTPTT